MIFQECKWLADLLCQFPELWWFLRDSKPKWVWSCATLIYTVSLLLSVVDFVCHLKSHLNGMPYTFCTYCIGKGVGTPLGTRFLHRFTCAWYEQSMETFSTRVVWSFYYYKSHLNFHTPLWFLNVYALHWSQWKDVLYDKHSCDAQRYF